MTGTYKVGAGSGGGAYIAYLLSKAVADGHKMDAVARYYAGRDAGQAALSPVDDLGQAVHAGDIGFSEALDELIRAEINAHPTAGLDEDALAALKERISLELEAAATRTGFREGGIADGSGARLRPDLDPDLAKRLEVDTARPLTVREMANLMDNRTALGNEIAGKKKHSAHRSVAETFGLDLKRPPSEKAIRNVLAGKRADGSALTDAKGTEIPGRVVESSLRKFKSSIGLRPGRDATDEEIRSVADGRADMHEYRKQIAATAPPVGYVDVVFSADKSVSVAYALAPTDAEAQIILSIVNEANADAMAYLESRIGIARTKAGGSGPAEPAKMAWITTQHVDARPTVDVVRLDAQGRAFSEEREVPGNVDPNVHNHNVVPSSILTASGRVASLNLDLLDGEVKVFGAIGHAALATRARRYGMDVALGPNGEARLTAVPEWVRQFHSRRSTEGIKAARKFAATQGKDWDALTPAQQSAMIDGAVAAKRRDKEAPDAGMGPGDRSVWVENAKAAGYQHRSVLRPDEIAPELTPEQRIRIAREAALPLLDKAFQSRSVLSMADVREIAARGLIASGIGGNPAEDIEAVIRTFHEQGITVRGERTGFIEARTIKDGRAKTLVTAGSNVEMEEGLLAAVRQAAGDRSTALTTEQIDRAAERFLAGHPHIDPAGAQWKAQREMMHRIGEGGRVSLSIGVAGSGKTSSVVASLVDAWHADGRVVYGMTVPWKSSAALRDAGVDQAVAIDAFLKRVESGQYKLGDKTVIVADEVSQIGIRHQVALLQLAAKHGAQLVEIGDPRQTQAVDNPALGLMAKAVGDENIPQLLTTIRQRDERGRAVATMFRDGQAADGIAALREDGRFHPVAGARGAVVQRTAELWRDLTEANAADPDYSLLVMTPTNKQALEIGTVIRAMRREAGEIGADVRVLKAMDPNSGETLDLPVARGDRLRMFTRTYDADTPGRKKWLSSNGDVVEVREVLADGLRIRNAEGSEGRVIWAQMKPWRPPKNDPVRVTYGYAVTIDSAQSTTKTAAIVSLPDGSGQVTGYKAYTGMSRHVAEAHLVVSDAAERRAIVKRRMLGLHQTPSEADVVRNIADNLSRFPEKQQATEMLARAIDVRRGVVRRFGLGSEAVERRNASGRDAADLTVYEWARVSELAHRVVAQLHRVQHRVVEAVRRAEKSGRSMRM